MSLVSTQIFLLRQWDQKERQHIFVWPMHFFISDYWSIDKFFWSEISRCIYDTGDISDVWVYSCLCLLIQWFYIAHSFTLHFIFSIFINIYLLYNGVSLWYFHHMLQCTLVKFIPSEILPHSPPLKNNSNGFHCYIFVHVYRVKWPCSPNLHLLSSTSPTSSGIHSQTEPVLHSSH